MKIACLGGGPAGLYFAISMKLRDPDAEITVIERNRPDDTFGWGVVLSDETLAGLAANDPVSAEAIRAHFAYWDDIAVIHDGHRSVSSGHGFCGIGRMRLLLLLQERARELGVEFAFPTQTLFVRQEDLPSHGEPPGADGYDAVVRDARSQGRDVAQRLVEGALRGVKPPPVGSEDRGEGGVGLRAGAE